MAPKQSEAPALFSLLVFLLVNYVVGFGIGFWLTHSTIGAIALALVTPCLSLLGIAICKRPAIRDNKLDKA